MLNAALIGYGYWGHILERYLDKSGNFNLQYICDNHRSGEGRFRSLSEIVDDSSIEVAFVATPTDQHFTVCRALLQSGKHVFCEKPATCAYWEWEELKYVAAKAGVILYVDYLYTCSPSIRFLKDHLEEIGNLQGIMGRITQFGKFYSGESVFDIIGLHLLSAMLFITGQDFLSASFNRFAHSGMGDCVSGISQIVLADGARCFIEGDLLSSEKRRQLKVFGSKGIFTYEMTKSPELVLAAFEDNGLEPNEISRKEYSFDEDNSLEISLQEFSHCIALSDAETNNRIADSVQRWLEESHVA